MKRLMLCALAVAAASLLGWLPATQKDVGDLLPVQTLVASREGDELVLSGDGDLVGRGASWPEAMEDLRATAPGEAFFGAAGEIVLMNEALYVLPAVLEDASLRPAARVYAGSGRIEPESAVKFLSAHEGGVTVQQLQAAALVGQRLTLPVLWEDRGRYHIDEG